jgi:hypothetical protein
MAETVKYLTKLSPDECLRRLETQAVLRAPWQVLRSYPKGTVFRKVKGKSFVLRASLGGTLVNSFEPVFRGSFEPHPEGTLIRGEFGRHRGTKGFTTFWTVFCVVMLAGFGAAVIRDIVTGEASAEATPYLGVAIGALLILFGWGLKRAGETLGAGQRAALKDFLRSRLEAQETEEKNAVIYKGFEILLASRKPPGQDHWRLEFILKKYNDKGEITLEKTCVTDNFFKTKKRADNFAIGLAKLIIDKKVPSRILDDA